MTVIKLIYDSVREFGDFPWGYIMKVAPTFKEEMKNFIKYLKTIEKDPLAGYKYTDLATIFPNLACLSYNMQLVIGGKTPLRDYHGVGSDRFNCTYIYFSFTNIFCLCFSPLFYYSMIPNFTMLNCRHILWPY